MKKIIRIHTTTLISQILVKKFGEKIEKIIECSLINPNEVYLQGFNENFQIRTITDNNCYPKVRFRSLSKSPYFVLDNTSADEHLTVATYITIFGRESLEKIKDSDDVYRLKEKLA